MASSSSGLLRTWRTAFLTLRDETLTSPPPSSLHSLLRDLILSQSPDDLVAAAAELPSHEVTSDVMLLAELAVDVAECEDGGESMLRICHLIHDISCKVRLGVNSASWTLVLNFLQKIVHCALGSATITNLSPGNTSKTKSIAEIMEIIRLFDKGHKRNSSVSESIQLVHFLVCVISCLHSELLTLFPSCGIERSDENIKTRQAKCNNLWEMQTTGFSMIGDALSRIGSSIPENLWQFLVEVMRKVMDFLASKNLFIVNNIMSRFFTTLLHCLHLVLTDPKSSLSGQVTGFGSTLQMFFTYGLSGRSPLPPAIADSKDKVISCSNQNPLQMDLRKSGSYVPPHLRKREMTNRHHQTSSDYDSSQSGLSSSDSELSDNDVYAMNGDQYRSSKARLAAIVCIQDLCHAEPKSLTSLCTLLLPENDVLQPRKYQATLMTCLMFDPVMKIRIASASTLASMLDGHSSTFLQVAEHKEPAKRGSFTTLSSSLGQILMQLHKGMIHLVQHETHNELLSSLLKVLMLLISTTPYTRMPENLLPSLIASMCTRIKENLSCKLEYISILGTTLSCLGAAFSVSPPSPRVLKMLEEDVSRGLVHNQDSSVLSQLIDLSEQSRQSTVGVESLQVLRAISHNYPSVVHLFWENISAAVYRLLKQPSHDDSYFGSWKEDTGKSVGSTFERCTMAAVKALDECLRAASGFKGADDLLEYRLLDIQISADCTRKKKVSSAPSYELEQASSCSLENSSSGSKQWCEVLEKHLPVALSHKSPAVRAAAITCFAGLTSPVYFSLSKEKQEYVISCIVGAALNDGVPSVRSAACRAIGVITCFSEIVCSARVRDEFIRAVDFNSHGSLASVRITACWALANICDSLRRVATDSLLERPKGSVCDAKAISIMVESALRLTKDGDKVQWNVCHALSNLFLNDTLKLHDMSWAPAVYSILLLLLRDSTNFKIRISAAVALAVPASRIDYANSFSDVIQGLVNVLESVNSAQPSSPSTFKYKDNLEKQLMLTTLHVLGFASSHDDQALKDFLIKKSSFLEDWFKSVCLSLSRESEQHSTSESATIQNEDDETTPSVPAKKAMVLRVSKAIKSLHNIYECSNNDNLARRFEKLAGSLS